MHLCGLELESGGSGLQWWFDFGVGSGPGFDSCSHCSRELQQQLQMSRK